MTGEQKNPASDLGKDQQGWVETYRRGLRFRATEPDYEEVSDDFEDAHGLEFLGAARASWNQVIAHCHGPMAPAARRMAPDQHAGKYAR